MKSSTKTLMMGVLATLSLGACRVNVDVPDNNDENNPPTTTTTTMDMGSTTTDDMTERFDMAPVEDMTPPEEDMSVDMVVGSDMVPEEDMTPPGIGPDGGEIALDGFRLIIPPGALEQYVEIKVKTTTLEGGFQGNLPRFSITPPDTALSVPATVLLDANNTPHALSLVSRQDDLGVTRLLPYVVEQDGWHRSTLASFGDVMLVDATRVSDVADVTDDACAGYTHLSRSNDEEGVETYLTMRDCAHRPAPLSSVSDLRVTIEGRDVSATLANVSELVDVTPIQLITILLDLSNSQIATPERLSQNIETLVSTLERSCEPESCAIEVLGIAGDTNPVIIREATVLDVWAPVTTENVLTARDALADKGTLNLYGGITTARERLDEHEREFTLVHGGGRATTRHLVLFGSSGDLANIAPRENIEQDTLHVVTFTDNAQMLASEITLTDQPLLPGRGVLAVTDASMDEGVMGFVASQLARAGKSTHAYHTCPTERAGVHTLRITHTQASPGYVSEGFGFEASEGFARCSPSKLQESCQLDACKSLACGGCALASEVCGQRGQCESACVLEQRCQGETYQGFMGTSTVCNAGGDVLFCGDTCFTPTSRFACGQCGTACFTGCGMNGCAPDGRELIVGTNTTCTRDATNGTLSCRGQLSGTFDTLTPIELPVRFTSFHRACGLDGQGQVWCYEDNAVKPYATPEPLIQLSTFRGAVCGTSATGVAYCGGSNRYGRLGTGDGSDRPYQMVPVVFHQPPTTRISHTQVEALHAFFFTEDGRLYITGSKSNFSELSGDPRACVNANGECFFEAARLSDALAILRTESNGTRCLLSPTGEISCPDIGIMSPQTAPPFVQMANVGDRVCGLSGVDGQIWCVATSDNTPTFAPVSTPGYIDLKDGTRWMCGVKGSGEVDCMVPETSAFYPKLLASGVAPFTLSPVGTLEQNETLFDAEFGICFGSITGQTRCLGGARPFVSVGASVPDLGEEMQVGKDFACGFDSNRSLECVATKRSEPGLFSGSPEYLLPFAYSTLGAGRQFIDFAISTGGNTLCAVDTGGVIACAVSALDDPFEEIKLHGSDPIANVIDIQIAGSNGCVLTSDDEVYCWGPNLDKQVDPSPQSGDYTTPAKRFGITPSLPIRAKQIALGSWRTCLVQPNGFLVRCYGRDVDGSLGQDGSINRNVAGLPALPIEKIVAAGLNTCVLHDNGELYCFGQNKHGQLGTGDALPVQGGARLIESGVDDVVMGEHHTCIKTNTGVISCAGKNELGQLGVMANSEVCDGSLCKTSF